MLPISPTPSDSPRTVISAKQFQLQPQFQETIWDAIHQAQEFHELVVTDVPQGWVDFLWEADESLPSYTRPSYHPTVRTLRLSESLPSHTRLSYDPTIRTLRLSIMVTRTHNCVIEWLAHAKSLWYGNGITNDPENIFLRVSGNSMLDFTTGPYRGFRKQPDAVIDVPNLMFPTLAVESGFSKSYDGLLHDMNRLLIGGNGEIRAVIIVKWTRHANLHVDGLLELYRLDRQGMPRLQQREIIFPMPAGNPAQQLDFERRELCGGQVQAGRNPHTILPLLVRDLRIFARDAMTKQGLIPA